jgi:hypothetical protein
MKRLAASALLSLALLAQPGHAHAQQYAHPILVRPYPACSSPGCAGCPRPTPGVPMAPAPSPQQSRPLPSPLAAYSVARPAPRVIWYHTLPTRVR